MKRLFLGVSIFAAGVAAADTAWKATADGKLDTADNWSDGLPSESVGAAIFKVAGASNLTLGSTSLMKAYNVQFKAGTGCEWVLDLGAGNSFYTVNKLNMDDAHVTLTSGNFGIVPGGTGERLMIGDTAGGSTLTVDGSDAHLYTANNNGLVLGQTKGDNTFVIKNGGSFSGVIRTGICVPGTNTVIVTGSGSTLEVPSATTVSSGFGMKSTGDGKFDTILFDQGAQLLYKRTSDVFYIGGYYNEDWGGTAHVTFANGSTFDASSSLGVTLGHYTASNELHIVSGSTLKTSVLNVGGEPWVKDGYKNAGRRADNNLVEISGTGSRAEIGTLRIGYRNSGGSVRVTDGATLDVTTESQTLFGGAQPSIGDSLFVGTNAFVRIPGYLFINPTAGSLTNTVTVCGGNLFPDSTGFSSRQIAVGRYGDGARLDVLDGGVVTATNYLLGICMEAYASNAVLHIANGGKVNLVDTELRLNSQATSTGGTIEMEGGSLSLENPTARKSCEFGRLGSSATIKLDQASVISTTNATVNFASNDGVTNVLVEVKDGSLFRFVDSPVTIGKGKTSTVDMTLDASRMEVLGSGARSEFHVGYQSSGLGTHFLLDNGSELVVSNANFNVGYTSASSNATLVVRNGSALRVLPTEDETDDAHVYGLGYSGKAAKMELDNGICTFPKARLILGESSGAVGASLKMTNGSTFEAYRLIIGCNETSSGCSLEVADSAITLANALQSSYEGTVDTHDVIYLHGTNTSIVTQSVALRKDATLRVAIPKEGLCRPMMSVSKFFGWKKTSAGTFDRTRGTFSIEVADGCCPGTYVIVDSEAAIDYDTIPDIDFTAPQTCRLIKAEKQIKVRVPSGLMILVK